MAEKASKTNIELWEPKTALGKKVKSGEITSLEQIEESGKVILEPEILDVLFPELEAETLAIKTTQRVTDSGRKIQFRAIVVVGDRKGHVGLGTGKSEEVKPSLDVAMRNAKKNMISIELGCGSWECKCSMPHSIPRKVVGKGGTTTLALKPAPKGLGLACNDIVKTILRIGGVKDVWSRSSSSGSVYNMALATMDALKSFKRMRSYTRGRA